MNKAFIIVIAFVVGCAPQSNNPVSSQRVSTVLPLTVDSIKLKETTLNASKLVQQFYRERNWKIVWSDSSGTTAAADSLARVIFSIANYGLSATNYHVHEIKEMLSEEKSHENAELLDFYLTDAFFSIWHHLKNGVLDKTSLKKNNLDSVYDSHSIAALNLSFTRNDFRDVLENQEPRHSQYIALRKYLERLMVSSPVDTTIQNRIHSVNVTLERWRWQGVEPSRLIRVNIPSFMLQVIEEDSAVLQTKVIIGKPETRTPQLQSVIRSFIIYPYWHVPRSIVKEILPQIQKDTLYLIKHNYDVLDHDGKVVKNSLINWPALTAEKFPYVLRQREGSENTMGVIKFIFQNNYNVYLHDTNARRLFSKADRALSHGCVRVHNAVALARYLIREDYVVSPEDLDQYLQLQHRMEIPIPKPIPVHLEYFTVESSGDSAIFHPDIYGKDKIIMQVLYDDGLQ